MPRSTSVIATVISGKAIAGLSSLAPNARLRSAATASCAFASESSVRSEFAANASTLLSNTSAPVHTAGKYGDSRNKPPSVNQKTPRNQDLR